MGLITIDGLDAETEAALETRAQENGRTASEEARAVLEAALDTEPVSRKGMFNLADFIRDRVLRFGGEDLELPERSMMPERVSLR
ncbi:plasmid stability protein [Rhizobium sp. SG_E_25_P2]|jgi:plasmid stability protein|uniref:FitA-like ribbon-helix-helix domain-containing protein n=1 Tax=Rhizobium sp. SG_E_25_P2 TaxID=2879942 RepID=UPI00247654D5|nr:TraY domain-containing protein [Rhizobium sp. SG_E_25_P2]MDH6268362.1 plasmid stability protein [Rhizobium sp. SG_E_25_P2]